jgi:iron complex transport system permease protein
MRLVWIREATVMERKTLLRARSSGWTFVLVLLVVLIVLTLVSFTMGMYALSIEDTLGIISHHLFGTVADYPDASETVFLRIRVPRLISCIAVGAALSVAGAVYQGIFKNPMASPDLLGASSGAALGSTLAILLGFSYFHMHILSFCMGLLAVGITYAVSSIVSHKENTTTTLVLTGMVVTALFNAGVSITKYLANPNTQLGEITFWLMGSMAHLSLKNLPILLIPVALGLVPILLLRYRLNILAFGDEEAKTLGLNVRLLRLIFICSSTLITSASVAACGIVGWIGLVVPHLLRMLLGPDYEILIPASLLGGAIYLLAVDNITRVFFLVEIPIGILTALIGAPFFLVLLSKGRKGWV